MMNYDQDLELYIPEGQTISPFRGLPTPPTEPIQSPPTHKTLTQLDSLPQTLASLDGVGGMTQKTSAPLDRVGGKQPAIGPKKRQRRGAAPRTPQQQARSVARRNARERKRVKLVNLGFATLRDHIPPHLGLSTAPAPTKSNNKTNNTNNKKLSKVETLRCAIEYIRQLRDAIGYDDNDNMDFQSFDLMKDVGGPSSVEVSSPAETSSSFASGSSSPVPMLESPSLFDDDDENDDFFNIVDWTTL